VAEALEVGIMWVNCSQPCFCQAPWGGNKVCAFACYQTPPPVLPFTICIIILGKVYLRSHPSRELASFSMHVIHAVIACFARLKAGQL